MFNEGMEIM